RVLGLTGLVIGAAGLIVAAVTENAVGLAVAGAGGLFVVVALFLELKGAADLARSRRGAQGSNVALQILLAGALLVGVNIFSFFHYSRLDCTRDREFTLSADPTVSETMLQGLGQLRGETRIVVYERHTAFGQQSDKQDSYAAAAERKIVQKVRDLAE